MKKNTSILSTILMAIAAITLLIVGVTVGFVLFIIAGLLFFIAILIMRVQSTRKLNEELKNMEKVIENEASDPENK